MPRLSNVERIRRIALALPEAHEELTWGDVNFRVRKKIFAFPGDEGLVVKADPEERDFLLSDARFYKPAYVGDKGWVGLTLPTDGTGVDWDEVAELVETSYRLIAPKTLVKLLDGERSR